jgi:transcriptional regulator with XRE-family HTH domain
VSAIQFPDWLQEQLDTRGWDQAALAERSRLTNGAISHVLNGSRQAGVDFCIAIARAFGIPREEVFKVRGWLSDQPRPIVPPDADPRLVEMAEAVRKLPFEERERILDVWEATLKAVGVKYRPD